MANNVENADVVGWDIEKITASRDLAETFEKDLGAVKENYDSMLNVLEQSWSGEAAKAHISDMKEVDVVKLEETIKGFKDLANILTEVIEVYKDATSDIVNAVEEAEKAISSEPLIKLQPIEYTGITRA